MVLKEDFFLWFKNLDATNRLHVMHGLLNMCLPFELRFLGNCIEELCRKDFLILRERELKSNNIAELQKLININDDCVRTQLILAVALLQASNRACATTIFNTLISNWTVGLNGALVGEDGERYSRLVTEIHLLINMALMHPAFTFDQKRTLEERLKCFYQYTDFDFNTNLAGVQNDGAERSIIYQSVVDNVTTSSLDKKALHCNCDGSADIVEPEFQIGSPLPNNIDGSCPIVKTCCAVTASESTPSSRGSSCSAKSLTALAGSAKVPIKIVDLKITQKAKKKTKKSKIDYPIQVTWSNGVTTEICKSHQELCEFHKQLKVESYIPYFTGPKLIIGNKIDDPTDEGMGKMADYLKQLMVKVPHLLDSELVTKFFGGSNVNHASKLENESVEENHQPTGTFSSSSSSLSSSSSASLPGSPPPPSNTTTMSNNTNCLTENIIDNVDSKMKNLVINTFHSNVEEGPTVDGSTQPQCNAVHPVQNQIFMPDEPLDFVLNYSIAPIAYMDIERGGLAQSSPFVNAAIPADQFICNGAIERTDSPHVIPGNRQVHDSQKGFDVRGVNRPHASVNGGRSFEPQRSGNNYRSVKRRDSLKSCNVSPDAGKVQGVGELNDNNMSSEVDGNISTSELGISQSEICHAIGKVIPSFSATTSVTYSLSQQHHQQVIGSHQQQQQAPLHLAGNIGHMGAGNRLPNRPTTLGPMCPCSRASNLQQLPPTLTPVNYTFMPLIQGVYTGFSPAPPGSQTSYMTAHSTNGYVTAGHPPVQPPTYFTSIQSPDCLSNEMAMSGTITNRFPLQQSGGAVVTQQPPHALSVMVTRTSVPHTSMPPPPSPVPGFLTGPTPNVGFHGNQIPMATQLSMCGGMNPHIPNCVIANPNVRLKTSCYNCGNCGHQGSECNEVTMDEANRGSQFRLSYHMEDVNVDGCD